MVNRESKYISQQITKCYGSYIWFLYLLLIQKSFVKSCTLEFRFNYKDKKRYSWLNPTYFWNKQPAHTPFPKKINTPRTTLRFIRFVAKISVLNPKLPADGQWPKKTKESVTFFIWSPLINKLKKSLYYFTSLVLNKYKINKKSFSKLFFIYFILRFPNFQ